MSTQALPAGIRVDPDARAVRVGGGVRYGDLATDVRGLRLIAGTGQTVDLRRGEAGFDGAVVSLGALGA